MYADSLNLFIIILTFDACFSAFSSSDLNYASGGSIAYASAELSALINKIWNLDHNRLNFGRDIRLSYQSRLGYWSKPLDQSPNPLFVQVDKKIFERKTYKSFRELLDNYKTMTGQAESVHQTEINENFIFLNDVLDTQIMKEVYMYLHKKGKTTNSYKKFKHELYEIWFRTYYRSSAKRIRDSSGFEHVFVGELKNGVAEVTGFHNWIQFYLEEQNQHLNYYGYMKKTSSPYLLVTKFTWYKSLKHVGSLFVGTSPEFEFSLYTLIFLLGHDKVEFTLDNVRVRVTCFGIHRNQYIGTCYPDIV